MNFYRIKRKCDYRRVSSLLLIFCLFVTGFALFFSIEPEQTEASTPSLVQSAQGTNTLGASVTATFPGTATSGNLLIAAVGANLGATFNTPAGWSVAINQSGTPSQAIFYKTSDGTETGLTVTTTLSLNSLGLHIYEYTRAYQLDQVNSATGTSTTVSTGSITISEDDQLVFAAFSNTIATAYNNSWSNGFTERRDFGTSGILVDGRYAGGDLYTNTASSSISTSTSVSLGAWRGQIVSFTKHPPTGSFNNASQKTDGSGDVDISIEIDHADDEAVRAKLNYETDSGGACDGPWAAATLLGPATADFNDSGGAPDIDNGVTYQVGSGSSTHIITTSGSNTVQFDWDSDTDLPTEDGTRCLQLTANDDFKDQVTLATITLSVDNVDPIISATSVSPSTGTIGIGATVTATIAAGETGLDVDACTVNGEDVSATFVDNADNTYSVTYVPGEGDTQWTVGNLVIDCTLIDANGNSDTTIAFDDGNTLLADLMRPTVSEVHYFDLNTDGEVDRVDVTFTENVSSGFVADKDEWTFPTVGTVGLTAPSLDASVTISTTTVRIVPATSNVNTTGGATSPTLSFIPNAGTLQDAAGNDVIAFGPTSIQDDAAPIISSTTPVDDATGVSRTNDFQIIFSEPMNTESFSASSNPVVALTPTWSVGNTTVSLAHASLNASTLYIVTVDSVVASGGNVTTLAGTDNWDFTTSALPPITSTAVAPSSGTVGIGATVSVTITIAETGLNVDACTVNTEDVSASFVDNADNTYSLAYLTAEGDTEWGAGELEIDCTLEDGVGNQVSTSSFDDGNTLAADLTRPTLLEAHYFDVNEDGEVDRVDLTFDEDVSNGFVADKDEWTFPTPGAPALTTPADDTSVTNSAATIQIIPGSASANTTGGAAPTISFSPLTGTLQDVFGNDVMSSGPFTIEDDAAPVIVDTTPSDGAIDVSRTDDLQVVFSETMDPASFTATLLPSVSVTSNWSGGNTINSMSHGPMTGNTQYTVTVTDANASSGNVISFVGEDSWEFETVGSMSGGSSIINPQNLLFTINPTDCASSQSVFLHFDGQNVAEILLSEDPFFLGSVWETAQMPLDRTWTFSDSSGEKMLYVMFRSGTRQQSQVYSDDVLLDLETGCGLVYGPPEPVVEIELPTDEEEILEPEVLVETPTEVVLEVPVPDIEGAPEMIVEPSPSALPRPASGRVMEPESEFIQDELTPLEARAFIGAIMPFVGFPIPVGAYDSSVIFGQSRNDLYLLAFLIPGLFLLLILFFWRRRRKDEDDD